MSFPTKHFLINMGNPPIFAQCMRLLSRFSGHYSVMKLLRGTFTLYDSKPYPTVRPRCYHCILRRPRFCCRFKKRQVIVADTPNWCNTLFKITAPISGLERGAQATPMGDANGQRQWTTPIGDARAD